MARMLLPLGRNRSRVFLVGVEWSTRSGETKMKVTKVRFQPEEKRIRRTTPKGRKNQEVRRLVELQLSEDE